MKLTASAAAQVQERILLIEDNEEAALLVKLALEEYGNGKYQLVWAKCLKEGQERLLERSMDLIVLDLGLPESTGAQTFDSVRTLAPEVPVLVLTGDDAEETESKITARGGDDFLVKDQVSGPLLVRAIQSALYSNKLKKRA